ncbi:MAG TPA: PQQ-binding-like beta-propeller repeat protein [Bacteroidales bacterium]|nr:PQQ-binding-like beta-propeller repeat protein [Bacteroidales bacterium]HPS61682.1 PQQ-binding-like beta-propeller repeat protein [Bacteroidales bacterium]
MRKVLILWLLILTLPAGSQVTAQWRGPARDGIYPGENLAESWPSEGPALLWQAEGIGTGYSSVSGDGDYLFVTGKKGDQDVMTALTAEGKIRWQTPFGPAFDGPFPETRTTPTYDGERVYAISGKGTVACLDPATGSIVWKVDGIGKFGGVSGTWGVCESPLVFGNTLIYTPAGPSTTMVALDKTTGKTIWTSASINDTTAYVSPRLIRTGNRDIIATLTERWFFGVDAADGRILWKFDFASYHPLPGLNIWPGAPRTNTITPLYDQEMIYITGGYDHGGLMFRLSAGGDSITRVWADTVLDCHHGGVVKIGNCIYGSNWLDNSRGNWCCLDWATGKTLYEEKWFTKGAMIAAGGMLYILDEKNGHMGLVKADPARFEVTGSFVVPSGKGPFWAHPVISHGKLLIRHGDVLMAYDISRK